MDLQVLQEKGELGEQVAAARMERNALLAAQRAGQGQRLPTTPSVANRAQPLEPSAPAGRQRGKERRVAIPVALGLQEVRRLRGLQLLGVMLLGFFGVQVRRQRG